MNTCMVCSVVFVVKRGTKGKYCSYQCYWKSGQPQPARKTGRFNKCGECKKLFYVARYRFKAIYCSNKCRGQGLVGKRISPETEFKLGQVSHRKGRVLPEYENDGNPNWKGDGVGYHGLHKWVERHKGRPMACMRCTSTKNVQWANKSRQYLRDLSDFIGLCASCHKKYDLGQFLV